jgi:hypothetical protein
MFHPDVFEKNEALLTCALQLVVHHVSQHDASKKGGHPMASLGYPAKKS